MNWRRANRAIHRDLGYLVAGFTLLYAVSGVLLNHIHDWNPMYAVGKSERFVGAIPPGEDAAMAAEAARRLSIEAPVLSTWRPDEANLVLFFEGGDAVAVELATGRARLETVERRTLTSRMNDLHLNRPRGAWTWIADAVAVALGLVALSGALLLFRPGSVNRRGLFLTLTGLGLAAASFLFVLV